MQMYNVCRLYMKYMYVQYVCIYLPTMKPNKSERHVVKCSKSEYNSLLHTFLLQDISRNRIIHIRRLVRLLHSLKNLNIHIKSEQLAGMVLHVDLPSFEVISLFMKMLTDIQNVIPTFHKKTN